MTIDAYVAHSEGEYTSEHFPDTETRVQACCLTYPCVVTDEHSQSSYGLPVVTIDGRAYGSAEIGGFLHLPESEQELAAKMESIGYAIERNSERYQAEYDAPVYAGVDEEGQFEDCYENSSTPVDFRWMGQEVPGARLVGF